MSAADIVQDIGEIYARLFDHQPFTTAEIQYFQREFEGKRNDREIENLFASAQNTTEVKDSSVARSKALGEVLPALNSILRNTFRDCERAVNRQPDPKLQSTLEKNRAERKVIWDQFTDDMNHKCSRIDNTFEEKEEELRDFYSDLERKLHIHK